MHEATPMLSVDDAVAQFQAWVEHMTGDTSSCHGPPVETPQEAEARRFRCAETLLRVVCPDPRLCTHHLCRRNRLCRHFANLHAVRDGRRQLPPSRRPPGAIMLRHAIWVFMNGNRDGC